MQDPNGEPPDFSHLQEQFSASIGGIDLRFMLNKQWPAQSDSSDDSPANLTFKRGDIITVTSPWENDWWLGEAHGKRGRFRIVRLLELDLVAKLAHAGGPAEQNELGRRTYHGYGVEQDEVKALAWFQKAADGGNAYAQYNLGLCLAQGLCGLTQDATQAVHWYRKSAELGDAYAQHNLAVCYGNGTGVEQDETRAVYWHLRAAQQGDVDGQTTVGRYYTWGWAGSDPHGPDYCEAVDWLHQAVAQGSERASVFLPVALRELGLLLERLP